MTKPTTKTVSKTKGTSKAAPKKSAAKTKSKTKTASAAKNLVIVESPAKAKTIKKYLGANYDVLASNGHIRDLPKSKLGIDVENGFTPTYINMTGKKDVLDKLKKAAAGAGNVYLATDPDREGEAISWHLAQILALDTADKNRITFNEITKTGINNGMQNPRAIDLDLVDAQQARRVFDRLVGYKISPFLWKKVKSGLSAGRVQSVAVRMICDREVEIRAFIPEEYWSLDALLSKLGTKDFAAKFHGIYGSKEKIKITNEDEANALLEALKSAQYSVDAVKTGTKTRQPAPPFITSTLQQEASRKLGFTSARTMRAAQSLYEGVEVDGVGTIGLITYMRTDSLRISEEARTEGTAYIGERYGTKYLPETPRYYKSKSNAQDAHEAVRPSTPSITPEQVKDNLASDQYKLYNLIWKRFIASLMSPCKLSTKAVDIKAAAEKDYVFKASGFTVEFDGFTVLYVEDNDDEEEGTALPDLKKDDVLSLKSLEPNQHFTQPPPRYTEATLIKALEENGIGRPSTYAPTISTIISREYVERDKKALLPTALGEVVTDLMKGNFSDIVDVDFTAKMETDLDKVEDGKLNWVKTVSDFYGGFEVVLETAEKNMDGVRVKVPEVETEEVCDLCGRNMVIKSGRFGKFLACPGYPECKSTKPIVTEMPGNCPKCGGKLLQKKSKNGNKFFGCGSYPTCDFMTWDEPTADACPDCGKTLFKRRGGLKVCNDEACGYQIAVEKKGKKAKKDE